MPRVQCDTPIDCQGATPAPRQSFSTIVSLKHRLAHLTKRFRGDKRGNVAIIFGASAIPALMFIGAGVDYSMALRARTQLQAAVDSAALAAVNAANLTNAQRQQLATDVFNANVKNNKLTASATPNVSIGVGSATVTSNFNVPTAFIKIAYANSIPVSVQSNVTSAGKKLELAMMIDITGSMADPACSGCSTSKISDVKLAAQDLLNIVLPTGGTIGAARVSLVPFSHHVNVGNYATTVTGMAPTKLVATGYWNDGNWVSTGNQTQTLVTCVTERTGSQAYTDAAAASGQYIRPYNTSTTSSSDYSSSGKCYQQNSTEMPQIMPLTTDKTAIMAQVNAFQPGGSTAGHLGTAWSWYTISPNWAGMWPTGSLPAAYSDNQTLKAVVLMTDGEYNTQYTNIDSKTQALALCTSMKNAGIQVYTVGFGFDPNSTSDNTARNTLTQCASGAGFYYFPYNGDALRQAFATIGQLVTTAAAKTRVSQ